MNEDTGMLRHDLDLLRRTVQTLTVNLSKMTTAVVNLENRVRYLEAKQQGIPWTGDSEQVTAWVPSGEADE